MAVSSRALSVVYILSSLFALSTCQNCSNFTFSKNRVFNSCIDLPYLDAHLHWNYISSTGRIELAYRASQTPTGWIAWAINLTGYGMPGSQALVAFQNSNGSLIAYPTQIRSYSPSLRPHALSFPVPYIAAEYANNEMIIFAVIGPLANDTTVNHLWQTGSSVSNDIPQIHQTTGPHVQSMGTLDFLSGKGLKLGENV
ncbi:hypothetical protein IFM89_027781 [Coptis chinensis]|uniref:DOMON domain-containing protein n=1 Tax=Coptis chinensis TaxID=261450 RepID=A0A835M597_9MAGN|nr:hypothetical protein IFM89_027781 [Coptis chinensis]